MRRIPICLNAIGITSIFVTHDQEEAFVISDRTILLNKGKMVQEGTPNDLYLKPANSFVAEFIGKTNILKASSGPRHAGEENSQTCYC